MLEEPSDVLEGQKREGDVVEVVGQSGGIGAESIIVRVLSGEAVVSSLMECIEGLYDLMEGNCGK